MKFIYFILLLVFTFCEIGLSQMHPDSSYRFPGENSYRKAKIYFNNNMRYEVSDLKIVNDQLTFTQKNTSAISDYNLDDVQIIKVSHGTYAGEYALYGGLIFALSALLAIVQVNSNPDYEGDVNETAIVGGFTAAGVVLGGIIGATKSKWKTLYVNEKAVRQNQLSPYALNIVMNQDYFALNLQLSY